MSVPQPVRAFARLPLSLLTRLRLILFGHEDLAGIVFWAALVGFCGALASVAFREGVRLLELVFTGQSSSLVHAAAGLRWWHRALVPVIGDYHRIGNSARGPRSMAQRQGKKTNRPRQWHFELQKSVVA
jgi:hypothetical protein